jgi:hypothetical protein
MRNILDTHSILGYGHWVYVSIFSTEALRSNKTSGRFGLVKAV